MSERTEMNQEPQPVSDEGPSRGGPHDGLAALAIGLLTIALIVFVVIQIV